jgi:hypothetical protein
MLQATVKIPTPDGPMTLVPEEFTADDADRVAGRYMELVSQADNPDAEEQRAQLRAALASNLLVVAGLASHARGYAQTVVSADAEIRRVAKWLSDMAKPRGPQ